eukprot:5256864-Prymnesium_polylepis.1
MQTVVRARRQAPIMPPPHCPGARAGRTGAPARPAPADDAPTLEPVSRHTRGPGSARYADGTRRLPNSPLID